MDWIADYYKKNDDDISVRTLMDYAKSIRPVKIYKYQPINDTTCKTLLEQQIWLSKRCLLNDPFESNPLNHEEKNVHNILSKYTEPLEGAIKSEFIMEEHRMLDRIIANKIEGSYIHAVIGSFSTTNNNYVLWGNYAEKNSGICVEYDLKTSYLFEEKKENEINPLNYLFPVEYKTTRSDISDMIEAASLNHSGSEKTRVAELISLLEKHPDWAYEDEWRIILPPSIHKELDKNGVKISFMKPSAIYLGLNFKEEYLQQIKDYVERQKIHLYQSEINNSKDISFKFKKIN
ncbi:DUF2971 domain-containing protein [Lysinibacillus sp. NPDC094177]|uniref:DUF2971 domain-containing protein n=1 Tax=Lysinibacillus sp. NPDC094177 TaxID=3390580 RepID=UPI003CFC82E7